MSKTRKFPKETLLAILDEYGVPPEITKVHVVEELVGTNRHGTDHITIFDCDGKTWCWCWRVNTQYGFDRSFLDDEEMCDQVVPKVVTTTTWVGA